ncbi:hypothetical protein ScalyP_jg1881 [Parmales sp. scaly parma]|nr:hypothetical protein ScalyP_jg1881 [Parmales sp. scaly parma]
MLFLIPSNPIPPNHGIVLYCSSPTNPSLWSFLGSVTQTSPSKLLRTGWDQSDVFLNEPSATLGISIEPMDIIANLREMNGAEDRIRNKAFGKRIAQDLFNFMSSFNTNSNTTFMTVPTSILERWITRFEDKFDRNPSFFLS